MYRCELGPKQGALLGASPVDIDVTISVPETVFVGQALQIGWSIKQPASGSSLKFPNDYIAGGKVSALGRVNVSGLLNGSLDSLGATAALPALKAKDNVTYPDLSSGTAATDKEGQISVAPGGLRISFTPPKSKIEVNDNVSRTASAPVPQPAHTEGPIAYPSGWGYDTGRASNTDIKWGDDKRDRKDDIHLNTATGSATIDFEGTGIEYVGERHRLYGDVQVQVLNPADNGPITGHPEETVRPWQKSATNPEPVDANTWFADQILWSKTGLPYGKYRARISYDHDPARTFVVVDGFNVLTQELATPPQYFDVLCEPPAGAVPATVKVVKPSATPTPTTTRTATVTPTPKPTTTVTVTSSASTSQSPQVIVTPKGGAQTGEMAVGGPSGRVYVWFGIVLVLGSVGAGLVWRRRVRADSGRVG
ncbi:hypothetical protein [Acrocarpospora sp. B8E8]|uniref:hypothetical protein n=1 Tax=Acrocarpospora sp. B8E8 TaxID=3153572 RepID=UPI00325FD859